jgi:16S rRNA processing protein RimM
VSSKSSSKFRSNQFKAKDFAGYHCVGWIKSAHGIRGDIYVKLSAGEANWLTSLNKIYLLPPGESELVVQEILNSKPHKEGLIITLRNCTDRNQSEALRKSSVYITDDLLVSEPGEPLFLKQILNFTLCDPQGVSLGQIVNFSSNGEQDLLVVKTATGYEALVPFVDDFIVSIDLETQQVRMDLPQGLLEEDF